MLTYVDVSWRIGGGVWKKQNLERGNYWLILTYSGCLQLINLSDLSWTVGVSRLTHPEQGWVRDSSWATRARFLPVSSCMLVEPDMRMSQSTDSSWWRNEPVFFGGGSPYRVFDKLGAPTYWLIDLSGVVPRLTADHLLQNLETNPDRGFRSRKKRSVDSSDLVFSLSSRRHSYIGLVCGSRFIDT